MSDNERIARGSVLSIISELDNRDAEIERLRAHIAEIEAWHENGAKLFDNYAVGLGAMFGLGKWWGERPWGKAAQSACGCAK